jgi:hypothetical protein
LAETGDQNGSIRVCTGSFSEISDDGGNARMDDPF